MLTKLKQWLSPSPSATHGHPGGHADSGPNVNGQASSRALENAREGDIDSFIEAVQRADAKGHSPWVLRDKAYLDTLRRALEFTLHRQVWLQREQEHVEHWQGRLLALRHGDGPPLGMVLACRPDDEAAWQLRFFFISEEWKGSGHGARLLTAARLSLSGVPLQTRLPLACHTAIQSLEAAGFQRMYVDAFEVASYEAPAQWDVRQ
ncbi:GNAT family N-acetyltransferase [Vreelandella neptunia]|uniref:GNAT family N-acetyltransferase n=1 Tax=Vreelandella neptunia TaxID=115551 RepID=A0ABZ0YIF2_9GAMM|nr:GNAT family N-acetyltransferase [Halomonas neptunia]MDN3560896.1 GNAT family N-acetyltransferase [Halomonas neptunia]WQH11880.1 GNAT family N-acetyltransferase [Halomonas neptunia]